MRAIGFLLASLCGFNQCAFAQSCPAGIPSAGNPLCIPPDRENSPYFQGSTQPPAWADRWGAIVVDNQKSLIGVSVDQASKGRAQQIALKDCMTRGGSDCVVKIAYKNKCAALVWGDNGYVVTSAGTFTEAGLIGKEQCDSEDVNCEIYYSACSLPRRIR